MSIPPALGPGLVSESEGADTRIGVVAFFGARRRDYREDGGDDPSKRIVDGTSTAEWVRGVAGHSDERGGPQVSRNYVGSFCVPRKSGLMYPGQGSFTGLPQTLYGPTLLCTIPVHLFTLNPNFKTL